MIDRQITLVTGGGVQLSGHTTGLTLGYTRNRGIYRLAVSQSGEWQGLAVRACWHLPDGSAATSALIENGYVEIPASVTAQPGDGCITFEGSDGTHTVTSADLRYHVGANSGTEDGTLPEPGTPAWEALVSVVKDNADISKRYAEDAADAANCAQNDRQAVQAEKADALNAIGTGQKNALEAVKKAQTDAVQKISGEKQAALDAIAGAKDNSVAEVNAQVDKAEESRKAAQQAAELAGTRANTDKTLTIADAPADAKTTGEALAAKADKQETETALAGKSAAGHTHDDRYYTEAEVDTRLAGKANAQHTQDWSTIANTPAIVTATGYEAETIEGLLEKICGRYPQVGSVNFSKETRISSLWYNFAYITHRTGVGGDNADWGTLLLYSMTASNEAYIVRVSMKAVQEIYRIYTSGYHPNEALSSAVQSLQAVQSDTDAMAVDQEYRLTLLELGLGE